MSAKSSGAPWRARRAGRQTAVCPAPASLCPRQVSMCSSEGRCFRTAGRSVGPGLRGEVGVVAWLGSVGSVPVGQWWFAGGRSARYCSQVWGKGGLAWARFGFQFGQRGFVRASLGQYAVGNFCLAWAHVVAQQHRAQGGAGLGHGGGYVLPNLVQARSRRRFLVLLDLDLFLTT